MTIRFNEATRGLLDGKNFATVATVNPDGGPQTSLVWVKRDKDTMLFSTTRGRRKEQNLARDSRVSVTVFDTADPFNYVEIRGHAEVTEAGARELVDELANKYINKDYPPEPDDVVRVVVRVIPEKVTGFSA